MQPLSLSLSRGYPQDCEAKPYYGYYPQHFLYFFPLPQTQGSLRPTLGTSRRWVGAGMKRSSASGSASFTKSRNELFFSAIFFSTRSETAAGVFSAGSGAPSSVLEAIGSASSSVMSVVILSHHLLYSRSPALHLMRALMAANDKRSPREIIANTEPPAYLADHRGPF